MSDNLSEMLTLVSLVLTAWLVSYGSLGLFLAYPSTWRWKFVAVVCAFGPVYAAEAYELSITFILQTTLVFGFTRLARRRSLKLGEGGSVSTNAIRGIQPRLSDLCILTLIVAQVVAVFVQVPNLNSLGWISMLLIGGCSGLSIGVGVLIFHTRIHFLAKCISVAVVALLAALPLSRFDWLTRSFLGFEGWPPEDVSGLMHTNDHVRSVWLILQPTTTFVCIWLVKTIPWLGGGTDAKLGVDTPSEASKLRMFAVIGASSCWLGSVALTGTIYFRLCLPVPAPATVDLPSNNYQELAIAAKELAETDFVQKWVSHP
ncbi:MAG: hypothetical protein AAF394_07360, partial [Planctomycetota bacterium]